MGTLTFLGPPPTHHIGVRSPAVPIPGAGGSHGSEGGKGSGGRRWRCRAGCPWGGRVAMAVGLRPHSAAWGQRMRTRRPRVSATFMRTAGTGSFRRRLRAAGNRARGEGGESELGAAHLPPPASILTVTHIRRGHRDPKSPPGSQIHSGNPLYPWGSPNPLGGPNFHFGKHRIPPLGPLGVPKCALGTPYAFGDSKCFLKNLNPQQGYKTPLGTPNPLWRPQIPL